VEEARLWLLLRGADKSAPAVLWLHGGPGGAESPLFRLYNRTLEARFVVGYWDQRGAGRSYDADADPARLTIDQHLKDLDQIVDYVCAELGVTQVALIGHSWGSALGLLYAKRHPEKVSAFVGVGQLVNTLAQQRSQQAFVLAQAYVKDDDKAASEISAIGDPPFSAEQGAAIERWVDRYGGIFNNKPSFAGAVLRGVVRGYIRPWEIPGFIRANNVSLKVMNAELLALDLAATVQSVQVPVMFALGRYDRQVDARLAAEFFEALAAPLKRLVWFENSAHNVPFEEPELFNSEVIDFLQTVHNSPARGTAD
jgi:pimeloyl-ACP methyl ester carboxylesterase